MATIPQLEYNLKYERNRHVKKIFLLALISCLLFPGLSVAKAPDVKELMKESQKLSYEGQIEHAQELMGKEKDAKTGPGKADDGWDMTSLMLGMIWGAIGTGYFIYGKKQAKMLFLLCGIGLCVFPMLVSSNTVSLVLGLVMCIAPFKVDL